MNDKKDSGMAKTNIFPFKRVSELRKLWFSTYVYSLRGDANAASHEGVWGQGGNASL